MVKSNAERQAEYRARHLKHENGEGERLNLVMNLHAKRALERLAACYAVTQRVMLERLIEQAERAALEVAGKSPNGQSDYYEKRLNLNNDCVTP